MLPNLPALRIDLARRQDEFVKTQIHRRLGVFSESPTHIVHEGRSLRMVRSDGDVDDSELKRASAEISVLDEEAITMTHAERLEKLDQLAAELAPKIVSIFVSTLDSVLQAAGQTVENQGKPLTGESILAVFEKIERDFEPDGTPSPLSFFSTQADMYPAFQRAMEEIERDPQLKARMDALMQRKKEQWIDREASRKLVG